MPSIPFTILKTSLLTLVLLAVCTFANALPAQDTGTTPSGAAPASAPSGGAPDASTPAAAQGGKEAVTVMQFLSQGGPVMYVLGLGSVCLVWFTGEGFFVLRASKLAPPAMVARLREALSSGNYQEAWNICKTNRCFLSNVLAAGLERVGRGKDAVEFAVEETALRESTYLKTNTTYLSVIGVVAPMIGLTGTVYGMIKAFHTLGENGISNPSQLAANIGEVLVATMSGLIVAVPAFIFFYVLRAQAQVAILHAEARIYQLLDDIPYEQLSGIKIGENFSADQSGKIRSARSGASQKVSRNVTTNCPACNAPITVGVTPCPNCGTVLDWGT